MSLLDKPEPPPAEPSGFGGWLVLLALGVCCAPLRTLVELAQVFADLKAAWEVPNGWIVAVVEIVLSVVLLIVQIGTVVAMARRRRSFRRWFTWLWIALIVMPIVDISVTLSLFPKAAGMLMAPELTHGAVGLVVTGLWVCYVHVSRRVANTFTN